MLIRRLNYGKIKKSLKFFPIKATKFFYKEDAVMVIIIMNAARAFLTLVGSIIFAAYSDNTGKRKPGMLMHAIVNLIPSIFLLYGKIP